MQDSTLKAMSPRVAGRVSTLGYSYTAPFEQEWSVVHIYSIYDRNKRGPDGRPVPYWLAHRKAGGRPGEEASQWADSQSCLPLREALAALEIVAIPHIDVPGNRYLEPPTRYIADGPTVMIWSTDSRQGDGSPAEVSVRATSGPIVTWVEQTEMKTKSCWRNEQPKVE